MIYTLSDARAKVAPYVQSGSNSTKLLDARINDALERLLDDRDWECLKRPIRLVVTGNTFALPYNAEKVLWCDLNGTPGLVFGQGYQYISGGPGDLDIRGLSGGMRDLMDLGDHWPTAYEIPRAYTISATENWTTGELALAAFASDAADVGKSLAVFGAGVDGLDRPLGDAVTIQSWGAITEGVYDAGQTLTTNLYSTISRVVKPATAGYVSLYAVDPTNSRMFLLAKYHPAQLSPQFRRYRVTRSAVSDEGLQSASANRNTGYHPDMLPEVGTGSLVVILALVRMRRIPLVDPGDILPIDSMQALLLAVRAVDAEIEKKDFALSETLMDKALAIMDNREEANIMTKGTPVILDLGYRTSLGRYMNRRGLL